MRLLFVMSFVMTLLMCSCVHSEVKIEEPPVQPPMLQNTIITDSKWSFEYKGVCEDQCGTWYHIPESDIQNLLLYVREVTKIK